MITSYRHIRYLIFSGILFFSLFGVLRAQTNMSMYTKGKVVTLSGETLYVHIRKVSEDKIAKSITILSEDSMETRKLSAKELSYVQIGDEEYFSKPYDNKKYLMKKIIDGPASLYELTLKDRKGNKSEIVNLYFAEKQEENRFVEVNKKDFRATMGDFVKDYDELSWKIEDKYYTYLEKEAVIEEYNEWVRQGKPGKTWRKEDGNFTRPEKEYEKQETRTVRPKRQFTNSRWGIDIPVMATYSFVNYPDILNYAGVQTKNGGFGYNAGIGARFDLTPSVLLRGGLTFRDKRFNSYYMAVDADTNTYYVNETGDIHYIGLYLMVHYESRNLVMGGGFDFSFANIYRAKYRITDLGGNVHGGNEDESQSIIAPNGFNMQFDLTFNFGYKINLADDRIRLKPVFQYSIPLVTLFDVELGSVPPTLVGVSGYLVQLGMIVDVGFKKKQRIISIEELN